MVLFINCCVRENSRTALLANDLLSKIKKPYTELKLDGYVFPRVDENYLKKRDTLISQSRFDDPTFGLARQFAEADEIVIAAPFWDLSFPAVLKQYFEIINVIGVTFKYNEQGIPEGLCRADKLYYVTTAGGEYFPEEYGFGYVKALAQNFYGIKDVRLIKATGLDIYGADTDKILSDCMKNIIV